MNKKFLISVLALAVFIWAVFGAEIDITVPENTTAEDNTPDLNVTFNESVNVTYSWDSEGNISGCRNCTSYNTTYGENSGSDAKLNLLFHFNENSGNTTFDDSGSNNDGTRGDAAGTQPAWTTGKFGPALEFDSVDDFVNVSDSPSLDFTENLTMAAWVYPRFTSWPTFTSVIGKNVAYAFMVANGKLRLSLYNGTQWSFINSPDNVSFDQWVHIAGTFNGTWTRLYINGVEVKSQAVIAGWGSSITTTSYPLQVGYYPGLTYFNGTIDEVAVYNSTLSAAEIWQMYKKSLTNGPHCVTVYANDSAGDLNSTERCFTVITTITIDSPANDTINGTMPDLNFTISDTANTVYSWDSGGNISGCRDCDSYNTTYGENDGSDANLVALYHFNENFSDAVYDDSGYSNDGNMTGANWTTGKFGPALAFDGTNDYFEVPDNDSLDISGNISVSAWINFADVDTDRMVLIKNNEYMLRVESGGNKNKIAFFLYNTTNAWEPRATTTVAKSPNTWHHVVGTWDQSTENQRLYVDGVLEHELTHSLTPTATTNPLTIGRWTALSSYFNGTIDEVAIYNRTLSAAEVLQMYVESLQNGQHCVTVYANNSAGSLNSTERCFTVSAPVPAKILAGTNRFSVWAPYNEPINYETDNLSSTFIAGALVMDGNGGPISGEYVSFMSYSGDSTLKAAIINTTNTNGIAYARYDTFGDFDSTGDPDYGTWQVVALVTDDTNINATRNLQIDADGYNAGSCTQELCHHNPLELNNDLLPSPRSPYSDEFGLSGTDYTMAGGGHLGSGQHDNNGCEFCHSGYGNDSGIPTPYTDSYPWGAHNSLKCTNSGCHGSYTSVFNTFPPQIPSCYDCHPNNNYNLTTVSTTATIDSIDGASVYSWNHNLSAPLMAHTTNNTYNLSKGIPCWICHGPMHNITKPDPAAANTNSYTETSQCTTCHSPKTEHNSQVQCTVCHSQDAHNISYFNASGNYTTNQSNAGNCTTCHQQTSVDVWNTILNQSKAGNYSGSGPPQVPVPLNHSDNTTGQRWGNYWTEGNDLAACNYCHGDTKHNATALGRLASWSGANTVNSSINATNNWCAGCHYQNYTSGSDSYTDMTSKFTGDNLLVPPEITNHSTYAPDENSGYFLHSFTSAPYYNDSQCAGCHDSLAPDATNMTAFMHNVATGKGCTGCHFDYGYMSGQSKPTKFLNETRFTASVHGNESVITCENCHTNTTGHPGSNTPPQSGWKWCEDCHVVNQTTPVSNRHNLTDNPATNMFNSTSSVMEVTDCTTCHNATMYDAAVQSYNKTSGKDCRFCHAFPDLLPGGD